eukprot:TRINITY_DN14998_c0_g1_i1.p2 TRINITY_DN14998_c0_g1~~TRINITY_DN14998_c0_g1_i1.p2  ORF type:complete len:166 (+),score=65.20 TRINITY_DN14998_c0_g1_i1:51-548(+)
MDMIMADMLVRLAESNDASEAVKGQEPSYYDAAEVPNFPVVDLVRRWAKFSKAPGEVLVMSLILIDRAVGRGLIVTSYSVHRVLISSLVVATKMHCDQVYSNSHYAKVSGISRQELNRLEVAFLNDIDFETHISEDAFEAVCETLRKVTFKERGSKKKQSPKKKL